MRCWLTEDQRGQGSRAAGVRAPPEPEPEQTPPYEPATTTNQPAGITTPDREIRPLLAHTGCDIAVRKARVCDGQLETDVNPTHKTRDVAGKPAERKNNTTEGRERSERLAAGSCTGGVTCKYDPSSNWSGCRCASRCVYIWIRNLSCDVTTLTWCLCMTELKVK